jgi:DNA-binding XRE family transcriptional regulator
LAGRACVILDILFRPRLAERRADLTECQQGPSVRDEDPLLPLNEGNLAQNVRRLAGMHLVSVDKLAQYVGVSRQTMQAVVAHDPAQRSLPKADTAIRISEAFAVSLNSLYSEPLECLQEALEHFEEAPIAEYVAVPTPTLGDLKRVAGEEGVPVVVSMKRSERRRPARKKGR